jgi:hypothetical protein
VNQASFLFSFGYQASFLFSFGYQASFLFSFGYQASFLLKEALVRVRFLNHHCHFANKKSFS